MKTFLCLTAWSLVLAGLGTTIAPAIPAGALPLNGSTVSIGSWANGYAIYTPKDPLGIGGGPSGFLPGSGNESRGLANLRIDFPNRALNVGAEELPEHTFRLEYPGLDAGARESAPASPGGLPVSPLGQGFSGHYINGIASAGENPRIVSRTVPEASSLVLMGVGLLGMAFVAGRRRSRNAMAHYSARVVRWHVASGRPGRTD